MLLPLTESTNGLRLGPAGSSAKFVASGADFFLGRRFAASRLASLQGTF